MIGNTSGTLLYAARPAVVARHAGQLAVLLAGLSLVPVPVALIADEYSSAMRYVVVAIALALSGAWLARREAPDTVQVNEAMVIGMLAFIATPLAMTWPLMASGIGFGDALFECISGITTTGLSTLGTVEGMPVSFLFERAWLQWLGGLGIVVLSVALLSGSELASRRLVESPVSPETLDTSTRTYARRSFFVYLSLTLGAIALLWLAGWPAVDAVLLALAAISTGGFAPHDVSLAASPLWSARWAVIVVALLGALPLLLYHSALRRQWKTLFRDPELRLLALLGMAMTVLLALLMAYRDGEWSLQHAARAAIMALSAQTTSGFAVVAPVDLGHAAMLVLIVAMAVGGSVGSTAGGIKLLRMVLLLRVARLIVRRTAMPQHAVTPLRLRGNRVSMEDLTGALFVVLLFVATVVLSWLPFLAAGYDPLRSLFEVVSAVGTVGLSAGVTGPGLPDGLKAVLCVDMLMGRVEFIAMLVMLYPRTWFGRRRST
jgi:trk system potassium uptake protein TrkH